MDMGKLQQSLFDYYRSYYRDTLAIPTWEIRTKNRQNEEDVFGEVNVRRVEEWLNDYSFIGRRVLVVGAGTGAESVVLVQRGADIWGIEPFDQALDILQERVELGQLPNGRFVKGCAENIVHPDNKFDFVYCYTVIEHVQDVEKSLDEMIRVCKPGGWIFIATPDYRFPYEDHYKVNLIPFFPRWMQRIYLSLRGKPTKFLGTLQFVTEPYLDRMFWARNVLTLRINEPYLYAWQEKPGLHRWFCRTFVVPKHQWIFLKKLGE